MNPLYSTKKQTTLVFLVALGLACFGLSPSMQAVVPAPDGGYPGGNTAEGQAALLSLTTGGFNTAVGFLSLRSNTTNSFNTAVGAGTLLANTADANTATGAGALFSNTMGLDNTASGAFALFSNINGVQNTADGFQALFSNTGGGNTATGLGALFSNTTGNDNTANGSGALSNNTTGSDNIALGIQAGSGVTTANHVIAIGIAGADVSDTCFIGNIFGNATGGAPVTVTSEGQLGTGTSSRRFKDDIRPMEQASEALFVLKPVTFRYKKQIDPQGISQFGLVAEDVEKVNPDLVVRDKEGKPYTVRYDQVNAMLLNEFLKEHRKVEEQNGKLENQARKIQEQEATITQLKKDFGATIVQQQKQIEALTAGLQRVSAQLELGKPAPQAVNNP
jgi:hypothetical protein